MLECIGIAIKLGENAAVSPEKLMQILGTIDGSSFSPSGILRMPVEDDDPISAARRTLREIRL